MIQPAVYHGVIPRPPKRGRHSQIARPRAPIEHEHALDVRIALQHGRGSWRHYDVERNCIMRASQHAHEPRRHDEVANPLIPKQQHAVRSCGPVRWPYDARPRQQRRDPSHPRRSPRALDVPNVGPGIPDAGKIHGSIFQPAMADLNPAQVTAATHADGPLLIIAGAGTGKTRALVHRVAHLIERGVRSERILLLTFTRRASEEMLGRVERLVGGSGRRVHGGTFHSTAHRLLRRFGPAAGSRAISR